MGERERERCGEENEHDEDDDAESRGKKSFLIESRFLLPNIKLDQNKKRQTLCRTSTV